LKDKEDPTRMRLIFANQTEGDILLRPELDAFAADARLEVHYVLSRPTNAAAWTCGSTGRVCEEMLRRHLFAPAGDDALALMCGPPGMQDAAMVHLEKWGYDRKKVVIF
jgi:NAD(P)H-flavin reductase